MQMRLDGPFSSLRFVLRAGFYLLFYFGALLVWFLFVCLFLFWVLIFYFKLRLIAVGIGLSTDLITGA